MANATQPLTKRRCDAAASTVGADGRPRETVLWDGAAKGFGLRVSPAGAKSFILLYRAGRGRKAPLRKATIGKLGSPWTVETARREALKLLGQAAGGGDPAGEKARKRARERTGAAAKGSVRAAVEEWLRRDQAGNRTVGEVQRVMQREVLPAWGDRPLAAIRKRDVLELVDAIADRGAPVQANRALAYVRRLMNWAAGRDLIEANPAQFVEKPRAEARRERVLDDAELVEVWRAVEGMVAPFAAGVRLLILTGARRSEVFEATRPELTGDGLRLPAARAKANEGRLLPLSPPALALLEALPRFAGSPWLLTLDGEHPFSNFGHAKAELDRRVLAARREAAGTEKVEPMPPWRLHDLRRSVATGMQRLGVRLEAIEAVLGHVAGSRSGIVGVYQKHRFETEAREAVKLWGEHVLRLLDPTPAKVVPMRGRIR
jgi:integrase